MATRDLPTSQRKAVQLHMGSAELTCAAEPTGIASRAWHGIWPLSLGIILANVLFQNQANETGKARGKKDMKKMGSPFLTPNIFFLTLVLSLAPNISFLTPCCVLAVDPFFDPVTSFFRPPYIFILTSPGGARATGGAVKKSYEKSTTP